MITVKFDGELVEIEIDTPDTGKISLATKKDLALTRMEIDLMTYTYNVVKDSVGNFLKGWVA